MTKTSYQKGKIMALREFMEEGNTVSVLEMVALFGVQAPNRTLTTFKEDGMVIHKRKVTMLSVLKRINKFCTFKEPVNLPVKEILMTEYWVSK